MPYILADIYRFQSTLLMRGATHERDEMHGKYEFQSTLFMRGATGTVAS